MTSPAASIAAQAETHTRAELHRQAGLIARDLRALADQVEREAEFFDRTDASGAAAPYGQAAASIQKAFYAMLHNSRLPTLTTAAAEADAYRAMSTGAETATTSAEDTHA